MLIATYVDRTALASVLVADGALTFIIKLAITTGILVLTHCHGKSAECLLLATLKLRLPFV